MNKEQLGAFIAERRKEEHMTQKDLAARLHITDKAVSKWERGLSYPDVTLLEPLAEALWRVWVDTRRRIVSFHQEEGWRLLEFRSWELFQNCIDRYTAEQYRYQ
jgi:transcriptional regulator with XRE-family HTH domain